MSPEASDAGTLPPEDTKRLLELAFGEVMFHRKDVLSPDYRPDKVVADIRRIAEKRSEIAELIEHDCEDGFAQMEFDHTEFEAALHGYASMVRIHGMDRTVDAIVSILMTQGGTRRRLYDAFRRKINLNSCLKETVDGMKIAIGNRPAIELELPPEQIFADAVPGDINTLVRNMINNSKDVDKGNAQNIFIKLERAETGQPRIICADDGNGLDESDGNQGGLDIFKRGDHGPGGTGLGLRDFKQRGLKGTKINHGKRRNAEGIEMKGLEIAVELVDKAPSATLPERVNAFLDALNIGTSRWNLRMLVRTVIGYMTYTGCTLVKSQEETGLIIFRVPGDDDRKFYQFNISGSGRKIDITHAWVGND